MAAQVAWRGVADSCIGARYIGSVDRMRRPPKHARRPRNYGGELSGDSNGYRNKRCESDSGSDDFADAAVMQKRTCGMSAPNAMLKYLTAIGARLFS
jgi:hypothetical protein